MHNLVKFELHEISRKWKSAEKKNKVKMWHFTLAAKNTDLFLAFFFLVFFADKLVDDKTSLLDLGVQPGQTVQIEIQSANPISAPLVYTVSKPKYKLPPQITVKAEIG